MKTKQILLLLLLIFSTIFYTQSFAQRGRSNHSRGYQRNYYSQRSYSYSRPGVSLNLNNYGYGYPRGYNYYPYHSGISIGIHPYGVRIGALPFGYRSFYIGPDPYYYYGGTYYRHFSDGYRTVAPPLGAMVNELPPGAKLRVIDGQKYYELNGTFYEEEYSSNNQLTYRVVGTDGVLNTEGQQDSISSEPSIGDKIDKLPFDSKAVMIQGEKLFATPDGLYYKEVIERNKVQYELVGK